MGYGYGKDAIAKWRKSEYDVLREICIRHNIEISEPQKGRGYSYPVEEYKIYKQQIDSLKSEIDNYRQIVMQAENTEFSYTKMPFGQNIVSDKSLEELLEKLKAAAVAEKEILLRERDLSEREKIVSEKEKHIDFLTESAEKINREALANQRSAQRLEEKYFVLYNEQENLDGLYRKAIFQRDSFDRQLREKTSECSNLKQVNENYKKELSEIKQDIQRKCDDLKATTDVEIDSLKKDKRRLCRYIADVSQAVSVLGRDTHDNEQFFVDLTTEQRSLVLGIVDFCENVEKEYGFPDLAEEIKKSGGISEKILKEYKIWCDFFAQNKEQKHINYYER
ncbi:MAG: hypothetical protein K2K57_09245 [Oscillospiraceae bacterium]|nr:hypothetical protein [Oscillospiraceae bacterium]